MDYERIQNRSSATINHQGNAGVLSPRKLRSMLLGVEDKIINKMKNRNQETGFYSLGSQVSQIADSGNCLSEDCKDVDVITATSTTSNSYTLDTTSDRKSYMDHDNGHDKAPKRGPLSKPAPSKWDDAQKWIASPNSNPMKPARKTSNIGFENQKMVTKVVYEVVQGCQGLVPFKEPDTKRIDSKVVGWEADTYAMSDTHGKEIVVLDDCLAEPAINLSGHDTSAQIHTETALVTPSTTARPVSMRDMGTEMTPITSQQPSRNSTPVRSTTPVRSPGTSRNVTPSRTVSASPLAGPSDLNTELSEKELQMKTRREIIALGTQLGKTNIALWASKEEKNDASTTVKNSITEKTNKVSMEARATAWEEAEKAKYMARFKREEMKIQAWENHQIAKAEAEMKKTEVKVERMRGRAQERVMNKIADTKHKAEEKRASNAEQHANYIQTKGCVPSFCCCGWCC